MNNYATFAAAIYACNQTDAGHAVYAAAMAAYANASAAHFNHLERQL